MSKKIATIISIMLIFFIISFAGTQIKESAIKPCPDIIAYDCLTVNQQTFNNGVILFVLGASGFLVTSIQSIIWINLQEGKNGH
jgi:hypothetical protein